MSQALLEIRLAAYSLNAAKLSSRLPILVLALSLLLFSLAVAGNRSQYAAIEPRYVDYLRHERYARELIDSRFNILRIYQTPAGGLSSTDSSAQIWAETSYPYPLGVLIFFLPFSLASYGFPPAAPLVGKLIVLLFVLAAHVDTYLLYRLMLKGRASSFLALAAAGVFHLQLVLWSLNAQYEALPALLILMAARAYQNRASGGMVKLLSGAFFLKYQALLLLPALGLVLKKPLSRQSLRRLWPASLLALGVLTFDFGTFLLGLATMPSAPSADANPLNLFHLTAGDPFAIRIVVLWALSLLVCLYLARKRAIALAAIPLLAIVSLTNLSILQGWYVVWLFLPAAFARDDAANALAFWALGFLYLMGWLPDVNHLFGLVWPNVINVLGSL